MRKYQPQQIEPKWQEKWKQERLFSPDMDKAKKPYYTLMMFPYPSAAGLHVGNMYAFTGTDIFARFKRMQGFDVFEPIGLDGFGIHSENYALKANRHPMDLSKETEEHFYRQLTMIGNAYDWTRTVETYKPDYYKWTQWLFLQMVKRGLAYRKKAEVNWCPSCLTVLADEQVIAGECERCSSQVEKKELEQWFFKITAYAGRLLDNLEWIDWSNKVKISQKNWIGKSEGTLIKFPLLKSEKYLEVFTTRPDTLSGATFVVVSPDHHLLNDLLSEEQRDKVLQYIKESREKTTGNDEEKAKTGIFSGALVKNPLTGEEIPVWIADYVLMGYGTGAIMAVPAHDSRDFEFAKSYDLPIKRVVASSDNEELPFEGEGVMIGSGEWTGLESSQAREKISDYLEKHHLGKRQVHYHLRDWLISRQRYWGPPIPIIYCEKCGVVSVPEKDLPVELPYIEDFRPKGMGTSPLAAYPEFYNVRCPKCGGEAKRETDVSDTFLDSAWYFLRYPSTEFSDQLLKKERTEKWLPVDMYIGGAEHANLHLLYTRFVTMVLKDIGLINFEEPFKTFRAHGLIIKDGAKMSKSKGNIVNPDDYIKQYGADVLRTYLMFLGPYDQGGDFQDAGMNGVQHFLERIWGLFDKVGQLQAANPAANQQSGYRLQTTAKNNAEDGRRKTVDLKMMHKAIKKVGEDIANLKFNTAIAALMEWLNYLSRKDKVSREEYKTILLLLAPFAPHITEELYEMIQLSVLGNQLSESGQSVVSQSVTGKLKTGRLKSENRKQKTDNWSIHQQSWPEFDSKYLEEEIATVVVQVNGRVRDQVTVATVEAKNKDLVLEQALKSEKVQKFLDGKEVKNSIYVPGRILNLVLG